MPETTDQMKAADLLVLGTFLIRGAVARTAHPARQTVPVEPRLEHAEEHGDEQRLAVGAAGGRAYE
jgi:hypothetical protein